MEEQFVTYEIALKLKELGFNEWCWFQYYKGNLDYSYKYEKKSTKIPTIRTACLAPLWQQVIDWFREKYDIHISFEPVYKPKQFQNLMYCYTISTKENYYGGMDDNLDNWLGLNDGGNMFHIENSYYKAREQAILKVIELCKNN